jgi:peptide deformylase
MWKAEEGCLSLPSLIKGVSGPWQIKISYYNEQLEHRIQEFSGLTARMILHELDHTSGVLLINHMGLLTKNIFTSSLNLSKKVV